MKFSVFLWFCGLLVKSSCEVALDDEEVFADDGFLDKKPVADEEWPPYSNEKCSQTTKLKAMYGTAIFRTSLSKKPMTSLEVDIEWNALKFHPTENIQKKGGVYIAYTTGMKGGPGGYFGVQIKGNGGQFIFSIWDGDRTFQKDGEKQIKKSTKLAWPIDMKNCKRNCQDCGIAALKEIGKEGFTTGTKCLIKHASMKEGDRYKVKLERVTKKRTINTKNFGGFKEVHKEVLNEVDREVTGSVWTVKAIVVKGESKGSEIPIGTILFESDKIGFYRLGTFDEMLGCNKCNSIYHKDTRYGPKVGADDGTFQKPIKMNGKTRYYDSTCKKYHISGSKSKSSITFESGPFTEEVTKGKTQVW
ncbi:uncharacterized protein [Clytia hemisphaerica]|eukprot:TCONS_00003723-protein